MKHRLLVLFFSILLFDGLHAQKEANNWFFGVGVGFTWNTTRSYTATGVFGTTSNTTLTGLPTLVSGSPMNTSEGCFSISDEDGNLLMFSDGMRIWNKNMDLMPNGSGLTGHASSAQSGIIIPYPGSSTKYIAFTLGYEGQGNLSYSVVDMALDSNKGDVVSGQKNIVLTGASGVLSESVTAIRHSNREDFWIVAPGRGPSTYLNVWKVTDSGVQVARHSVIGLTGSTITNTPAGYIRSSPDGKNVAWGCGREGYLYLADFDNSTGMLSNIKRRDFPVPPAAGYLYGIEFSISGKYLYASTTAWTTLSANGASLSVFDFSDLLSNPSVAPIWTHQFPSVVTNGTTTHFSTITMAPDGRIYFGKFLSPNLYLIDNPEDPQNIRIYELVDFLGTGIFRLGLPTFVASWWEINEIETDPVLPTCINNEITFSISISSGSGINAITKVEWDFGDGSKAIDTDMTQTFFTQRHRYDKPGNYVLTLTPYRNNGSEATDKIKTLSVSISRCIMPVNPNINIMGY